MNRLITIILLFIICNNIYSQSFDNYPVQLYTTTETQFGNQERISVPYAESTAYNAAMPLKEFPPINIYCPECGEYLGTITITENTSWLVGTRYTINRQLNSVWDWIGSLIGIGSDYRTYEEALYEAKKMEKEVIDKHKTGCKGDIKDFPYALLFILCYCYCKFRNKIKL